ncbi:tRNA lysidine(34) synthetase TilS [Oceanicoccus sp. KOV_DT_Chl]|uniref:tRNA lysidine(34) synthetase TilS n=1 Tax=Oceanicoccus sp. KOV_DT_Chl TaxID=1904639 RepID=UPI000C7D2CDC|nr:tRNA lysidine(34) synthetase TilS [Oceanicoccus sp. KOV_DT_Chl]
MALTTETLTATLVPYLDAPRWLVAYSGGVDSHVLLQLLTHVPNHPVIEAVHINHQLQADANHWAGHCQQQADQLNIPLHTVAIDIDSQPKGSLEEQARDARYQVFESLLQPGDVLMMGHHLDDQVETLLLRLLRGSGVRGGSAMPQGRVLGNGLLLRPLLTIPRSVIESYANAHQLQWIEDPSNQLSDFDRNFLRLQLLPIIAERWPEYRQTLSRTAALNEEAALLNTELAQLDLVGLGLGEKGGLDSGAVGADSVLPLAGLHALSDSRKKNLLRYWLQVGGFALPSAAQLQAVITDVINAQPDAEPVVAWGNEVQVRRFNHCLYAMPPLAAIDKTLVADWDLVGG